MLVENDMIHLQEKLGGLPFRPPSALGTPCLTMRSTTVIANGRRARFMENGVVIIMIKFLHQKVVIMINEVTKYFRLHFDRYYRHCG